MACFHPVNVPRKGYVDLRATVACGRCVGCRIDRAQDWATRLTHEASLHDLSVFVTLTYSDGFMPPGGTLVKRDAQLFIKRLRKLHEPFRFRYFLVGEYGGETLRPHYHALLFGIDFPDKRRHSKNGDDQLYISERLEKVWGMGQCLIGAVTPRSASYVARYCVKKVTGDAADAHYAGRLPEFSLMSRRPGLGSGWYERFHADVYPSDFLVLAGRRRGVPAYYDKQLDKAAPADLEAVKSRRRASYVKNKAEQQPARLEAREEVLTAKLNLSRGKI